MKILIDASFSLFIMAFAFPGMVTGKVMIHASVACGTIMATEISPCPANGASSAHKAAAALAARVHRGGTLAIA